MNFSVLLSCMNQNDFSLIEKSNLKNVPTLIVNQSDVKREEILQSGCHKMLNTPTRGLSVSRNLAIEKAESDICLISDDDELFVDDIEQKILSAYEKLPQADIIVFIISNRPVKFGKKIRKLKKIDMLRVSSVRISFKLSAIKNNNLKFDEKLGAGTGNGGSEENKFLLDCYNKDLKIYFVPTTIATICGQNSTWFSCHNKEYFFTRGKTTRYIFGRFWATLYAFYFLIFKHSKYKKDISFFGATKYLFKGLKVKDIDAKLD